MVETNSRNGLVFVAGVVGVGLVILAILAFLPPFRLLARFQGDDYTALSAKAPVASHQDGIQILAAPDDLDGGFGVKLDAVPQLNFLEGSAGSELRRAAESLPANLLVKSPYYKIAAKGQAPDSTIIAVNIPNNAEPWETLDLYTWTGESWTWIGGRLDRDREMLIAHVGRDVPQSVVVMQVDAIPAAIFAELPASQPPAQAANSGVTHLLPIGLELEAMGGLAGDPTRLPLPAVGDKFALLPSLRNWSAEGTVNQLALSDLLADPGARQAHIKHILALVVGQGYAGVDLDYRGVSADWREAYSAFVAELAGALHTQGKVLAVVVEAPTPVGEGNWDTGGYDWRALGLSADYVRAPFNPASGDPESYLTWALSQVSRYKLLPILSTYSVDSMEGYITLKQALSPLSQVTNAITGSVEPGASVTVELANEAINSLQFDANSQTYTYTYHDAAGAERRVTLVTAASAGKTLEQALRYHLGGVAVAGMLETGSDPALVAAVQQFAIRTPPTASSALHVVWTVETADGAQLARDERALDGSRAFEWTAPAEPGEYTIRATVLSQSGGQSGAPGSVTIRVAQPETDVISAAMLPLGPPPTDAATPDPNRPTPTPVPAGCLNAAYVADVTVPDNTQFEKGETFKKTWRVRNSGACPWPEDTKLVFDSGEKLGGPDSVNIGTLAVGGETDISVDLAAPEQDGAFKGVWRLADGSGNRFGTILTVVIKAGAASAAPQPVVPPSGGGGGFELGGHINSWNFTAQMKQAGMTWAKVQVHYGQDVSGIVQTAKNLGFKIQLSALGTPGMVTQPNFHADYTNWLKSVAASGADAIEVWNEPNIDREWQIGSISPQAYTSLLCASYNAIKSVNPNVKVISAAPAPTGYFGGCSGNGCDDLPWLQGMVNAGAANCMDYIGAHHNSGATSPSATSGHPADDGNHHHSWYFLPQTQLYYNIFGGARKLFYTEMGYASQEGLAPFSDQFAWARGTDNNEQAAWLSEAVSLSRSTGMVANIIVWNIDFPRYGYDPQDGYAIIRPGGGCPACDALAGVMR